MPRSPFEYLWHSTGNDARHLGNVTLTGNEPALPSSFAVGSMAQACIAATALAAAVIHERKRKK